MLCDELKDHWFNAYPEIMGIEGGEPTECYGKSEVDAAIAELKQKLAEERDFGLNRAKSADHEIGKLCAELCELKAENRRLKRALWLARADRAVAEQTVDEWSRYKEKHPFGSWRDEPFEHWVQVWIYIEKLCRKIAKEYK